MLSCRGCLSLRRSRTVSELRRHPRLSAWLLLGILNLSFSFVLKWHGIVKSLNGNIAWWQVLRLIKDANLISRTFKLLSDFLYFADCSFWLTACRTLILLGSWWILGIYIIGSIVKWTIPSLLASWRWLSTNLLILVEIGLAVLIGRVSWIHVSWICAVVFFLDLCGIITFVWVLDNFLKLSLAWLRSASFLYFLCY